MIVAVTEDGELLLVEEYRVPLHALTIGLPAGISGDEGEESTLQSARRELDVYKRQMRSVTGCSSVCRDLPSSVGRPVKFLMETEVIWSSVMSGLSLIHI